jgi:hypothetical protein
MKRALQICLMLLLLLMQTAPLTALQAPVKAKCTMDCCAWLAEEGPGDCACSAGPSEGQNSTPAHLPPPSSNRDHIPLGVWKELPPLLILSSKETSRANRPVFNEPTRTPPHVRLMVLFCSFLN